ncbi:MAG: hypothetical protein ACE5LS_06045 [Thermoplasmata archaeon]
MKGWAKSTLVLLIMLLLTTIFFALLYRPPDPEAVPEAPLVFFDIRIALSTIEPDTIQVIQGSLVSLNLTSVDEDHHFGLTAFGISRWVSAGETEPVRFHANLAGTFTYGCLIIAPGHVDEVGTLRVVPQA